MKTYVGESGNLKARHAQYAADGDHLQPLLDAALGDGCTIWRRWRYVVGSARARCAVVHWWAARSLRPGDTPPVPTHTHAAPPLLQGTKEAAVEWEARFLSAFDYAWNARLNGRKRSLHLQQRWCCFCVAAGVELVEAEYVSPAKLQQQGGQRSPQQWRRQQRSPRKQRQPPAAKQLQFVVSA